jgi:Mg-chelatase subunit ChlD
MRFQAPPRLLRNSLLHKATLWLALITGVGCTVAHDWTSPSLAPPPAPRHMPPPTQGAAAWNGLVWAGPSAAAPAAPKAEHCKRLPQAMDLTGPAPAAATWQRGAAPMPTPTPTARAGTLMATLPSAEAKTSAESAGPPTAAMAAPAPPAAPSPAPARRAESNSHRVAPQALPAPHERPANEPVTAGVVDDNTDFGAYLAYRQRRSGLNVRDRDIRERYRLSVQDAAGRPVPDAVVSVWAGGQPQALWARTDAGGQAWLHPRAVGLNDSLLEVRVSKSTGDGEIRSSALLRRGQRDALQVRLDSTVPAEPARLDLVFLVDATGSMADEIAKLKQSMSSMAAQIARLPSAPDVCYSLVAYRDRNDEFFVRAWDFTNDLGAFQQALGGLRAAAGGDYPEALNEALHTAVHRLSWRGDGATRLVVLVADAPPHLDYGRPWYDDDMQGALARGIKVFSIAASGLDPSGEFIFRQLAQYTGGCFVFLTYEKATQPASGPGRETVHEVGNYSVETLDKLVLRLVREELARRPG